MELNYHYYVFILKKKEGKKGKDEIGIQKSVKVWE